MTGQPNPEYPASTAELIERIQQSWSELMACVEQLSGAAFDQPGPGGWTPKDNLAHVYEWERYMLRRTLRGESLESSLEVPEETLKELSIDEDGINELLYLRNKERLPGDVLEMLRLTHKAVVETLRRCDYAWLLERRDPNNPETPQRIATVIGNTYEHFDEHRANIEATLNAAM